MTPVKTILSLMAFFSMAMVFGVALITTKWNGRYEYEPLRDDNDL